MARLLAKAKEVREALYPVLQQSAFAERGVLTPDEFVQAGDELVGKCPTWAWESGDGDDAARREPERAASREDLETFHILGQAEPRRHREGRALHRPQRVQ